MTGIGSTTLTGYLRTYRAGGIEALKESALLPAAERVAGISRDAGDLLSRAPAGPSAKEAMAKIEELTGVRRSADRVRVFLKGLGMAYRKVGMVPAKANLAQQEAFKKTP